MSSHLTARFGFFCAVYFSPCCRKKHRPVPQRAPIYVEQSENGHDGEQQLKLNILKCVHHMYIYHTIYIIIIILQLIFQHLIKKDNIKMNIHLFCSWCCSQTIYARSKESHASLCSHWGCKSLHFGMSCLMALQWDKTKSHSILTCWCFSRFRLYHVHHLNLECCLLSTKPSRGWWDYRYYNVSQRGYVFMFHLLARLSCNWKKVVSWGQGRSQYIFGADPNHRVDTLLFFFFLFYYRVCGISWINGIHLKIQQMVVKFSSDKT